MQQPTNNMLIHGDVTLKPGVYHLPDGLRIAANGVTLDGGGAVLVGSGRRGHGLIVEGCTGVSVRNLHLREYYHGIAARQCTDLHIAGCSITATAEEPANGPFLDIWRGPQSAYGGGILLDQVRGGQVSGCDLQHQMCGLLSYACRDLQVSACNASYCSGFGFHLYGTTDSTFADNHADYCCRYHPRGEGAGHMGADAAGFLIVAGSSRNIFRRNMARLGGDGFFLAGLNPHYEHRPCNENLFEGNDASYSPNIGFEATFSAGNVFRSNRANQCHYGFWLGFSGDVTVEGNAIERNWGAGIAVENGIDFQVQRNALRANACGLLLWSKAVPALARVTPAYDTCRAWQIEENEIVHNRVGLRIAANQDHGMAPYLREGEAPAPHTITVTGNQFLDNQAALELQGVKKPRMERNTMRGSVAGDIVMRGA